jgi:16S rRNA G966 N2-methylase RsmD
LRIIGGQFGSRPLRSLRGLALRPTADRLRETLFNILGASVEDSVFVDGYAGTGAVGIEALSRGASRVVFIESHRPAASLIRSNLESLGIPVAGARPIRPPRGARVVALDEASGKPPSALKPPAEILALDAAKALRLLEARHLLADFVFLDPPYDAREQYDRSLEILSSGRLLAPAGRVIVESLHDLPARMGALECARVVEQGDTLLTFYHLARAA